MQLTDFIASFDRCEHEWIQERPQDFTVQEWALQARDRIKELEGQ